MLLCYTLAQIGSPFGEKLMVNCFVPFALLLTALFGFVGYNTVTEVQAVPVPEAAPVAAPWPSDLILTVTGAGDISTEALILENGGDTLDLTGWRIVDSAGNSFTFPEFRLMAGAQVTIATRTGTNTPVVLYWNSDTALWSEGVSITVLDADDLFQAQVVVGE